MPPRLSRIALALCLASIGSPLFATPAPRPATRRLPAPVQETASANQLRWLWNYLTTRWAPEGCGLDPSGVKCTSSPAPGGHATAVTPAPAGCGLDPSGC
jgi:hypothetical protein